MTNEELDKAVAEAQGWKLLTGDLANEPDYWVNGNIYKCDYHPSTNWQQAGELLEKYQLSVSYVQNVWICGNANSQVQGALAEANTPQKAIVLAVIALLEQSDGHS